MEHQIEVGQLAVHSQPCADGSIDRFWEQTSRDGRGLRAQVVLIANRPALRVFTGGLGSKRYLPSGTNAPLQVTGHFLVESGEVTVDRFSANFEFGDQAITVDPATVEVAEREAFEFVQRIVATSPSFAEEWDAAMAAARAVADTRADKSRRRVVDDVCASITSVLTEQLARMDGPKLPSDPKSLTSDPRVVALAEFVAGEHQAADSPDAPGAAVSREVTSRLAARGVELKDATLRLSEAEMVAVIASAATPDDADEAVAAEVRRVAAVAYDCFHDVYYNSGSFPDRGVHEPTGSPAT